MGLIPVITGTIYGINLELAVIVMAVIYTAISISAQRLLSNPKKMREIQSRVKILQDEMNSMMKSKAPQEQLLQKQKEFMPLLSEQMRNSMKPMLVVLPLLLITYYVIIPMLPIPTAEVSPSKELFFIIVFSVGIVTAAIILLYDRKKGKEEMKEMLAKKEEASKDPSANYVPPNNP